jgi:hypothetical protein
MWEALQMKEAVDKQEEEVFALRVTVRTSFARRHARTQDDLAVPLSGFVREHVRDVLFPA